VNLLQPSFLSSISLSMKNKKLMPRFKIKSYFFYYCWIPINILSSSPIISLLLLASDFPLVFLHLFLLLCYHSPLLSLHPLPAHVLILRAHDIILCIFVFDLLLQSLSHSISILSLFTLSVDEFLLFHHHCH